MQSAFYVVSNKRKAGRKPISNENKTPQYVVLLVLRCDPSSIRIIGGEEIDPHSRPFQIAIYVNDTVDSAVPRFYCGGSIYDEVGGKKEELD